MATAAVAAPTRALRRRDVEVVAEGLGCGRPEPAVGNLGLVGDGFVGVFFDAADHDGRRCTLCDED